MRIWFASPAAVFFLAGCSARSHPVAAPVLDDTAQVQKAVDAGGVHTLIDGINVQDPHGQALYSYLAKDLIIQNSPSYGDIDVNEFGATVDLDLHNNIFSCVHTVGFGLDFGTFFFNIADNSVPLKFRYRRLFSVRNSRRNVHRQ